MDQAKLDALKQRYTKHIGQALLRPNGPTTPTPRAQLMMGKKLRDETIWQFPIFPGAMQAYIDLASTREWTVSGPRRGVPRAVEWLNNAESINTVTGLVDYGFDSLLRRQVPDYLVVGMMTMAASRDLGDDLAPLEYIDPTLLQFQREREKLRTQRGFIQKVRPEERVWIYDRTREIRAGDLIHYYPNPIGANSFISPIMYLLPTATLAWLIRESDTMNIDGRKIRDIFLVSDAEVHDAIVEGVLTLLALWSGDSEQDVGIPIISLNGIDGKVSDKFARMGISEVPPTLNREEFTFSYVNEIAAALGLALRHFWNNERTTNRALEVVQEQRQQQKGPSTFVRTLQRLINRSGWLKRFGGARKTPRFAFIEETDISSMKDRAAAMRDISTALGMVQDKLGMFIKPESLVAWMQMEGVLPNEIELIDLEQAAQMINPDTQMPQEGDETASSDPQPTTQPTQEAQVATPKTSNDPEADLEYGDILMKGDGTVLAKRNRIYTAATLLSENIQRDIEEYKGGYNTQEDLDAWVASLLKDTESHNEQVVRQISSSMFIETWTEKNTMKYSSGLIRDAIHNCLHNVELNEEERKIVDALAFDWEADQND